MQALVSGKAARAAFVQGTDVSYINADRPAQIIRSSLAELKVIFLGADDVETIEVSKPEQSYELLLKKFNFDRGLHLLDIALTDNDPNFRIEAAQLFQNIMDHAQAFEEIKNYVFAVRNDKLPEQADLLEIQKSAPKFAKFLDSVHAAQIHILRFHSALDRALSSLHVDDTNASEFKWRAISTGSLRALVESKGEPSSVNSAILECYAKLSSVKNARAIVQAWTKDVIHRSTRADLLRFEKELEQFEDSEYEPKDARDRNDYENYQAVKRQIGVIKEKVRQREFQAARRFTDQLIKMQMQHGGSAYAAKTLTTLAMEARKMGQHSLELEWAHASVEIEPNDTRALGVLADTYLDLFRIPEAEEAFARLSALGEEQFGQVGLGRVQRACGRHEEALKTLQDAITRFRHQQLNPATLGVYAETLRDLWRIEDALEEYSKAIEIFPNEASLYCGKASVLTELGRLRDAISLYEHVNTRFGDTPAAWCGLATTAKIQGDWQRAISTYEKAVALFPDNVISYCGRADVFRAMGNLDEALSAYREAASKFPYSPYPASGEVETLKDMRNFSEVLSAFEKAREKFPLDSHLRNGFANALKLDGQFAEALRQFDQNVRDFPYDLYALGGRANLLRLLGNYDAALDAYDLIVARRPGYQFANNAKAAILVAQGRYDAASKLLPDFPPPQTEEQWRTLHIRGMALLRQGHYSEARTLLKRGLGSQFLRQKTAFEIALALVDLKEGDAAAAVRGLSEHKDNLSQLLHVHALLIQGNQAAAAERYMAVNDNLPDPQQALKSKLGLLLEGAKEELSQKADSLFFHEVEVILQAA